MYRGSTFSRQLVFRTAVGIVLLALSFLLFKSLTTGQPSSLESKEPQHATALSATGTKGESTRATESLKQLIDRAISESETDGARWGVSVISLSNGHEVFERNADQFFTPASNMKIFTTGVALDLLGAHYRWRTSVYAGTKPVNGTISGDLVLYGRGAPDLIAQSKKDNHNSLAQLADDLYKRGIRHIRGNVVGDESYFRGESLGEGWQWTDIQWYFGAEASALSINGNEIGVNILPPSKTGAVPEVRVSDPVNYISVRNDMVAVAAAKRMTIGIHRGLSDNTVQVWGDFPVGSKGFGARLSVYNPALWAASLFHAALKARGVRVDGIAQARNARQPLSQRFDTSESVELAFVSSKPLGEVVRATNKESINLFAELILRTLGRERGAMVPAPEPVGRERGDDEAGLAVIHHWLSRAQIPIERLALHDGSGLSRLNLVTPVSISKFLVSVSQTAAGPVFRESLPVSGRDGTLGSRLGQMTGKVSAKTGLLTYDAALSGYVGTDSGGTLAFSIICNGQTARASTTRVIDQIVAVLATHPTFGG